MRHILAALTAISIVALASQVRADDVKALQGTWEIVAVRAAGNTIPLDTFTLDAVVIKDNTLTLSKDGKEVTSVTFTVDATVSPKKMVWSQEEQGSLPAIYEVKGGSLRICFPLVEASKNNDIPTPESFDTKGTKTAVLSTMRK